MVDFLQKGDLDGASFDNDNSNNAGGVSVRVNAGSVVGNAITAALAGAGGTTNVSLSVVGANLVLTDSDSNAVQVTRQALIDGLDPSTLAWSSLSVPAATALAAMFPAGSIDPTQINFGNITEAEADQISAMFGDDTLDTDDIDWSALSAADIATLTSALNISGTTSSVVKMADGTVRHSDGAATPVTMDILRNGAVADEAALLTIDPTPTATGPQFMQLAATAEETVFTNVDLSGTAIGGWAWMQVSGDGGQQTPTKFYAAMFKTANQNATDGASTVLVNYATADDPNGGTDLATGQITVPVDGTYLFDLSLSGDYQPITNLVGYAGVNATVDTVGQNISVAGNVFQFGAASFVKTLRLSAGDVVSGVIIQMNAGAANRIIDSGSLKVTLISAA